jgi:tetratricopeptide (TPR) repeat protein
VTSLTFKEKTKVHNDIAMSESRAPTCPDAIAVTTDNKAANRLSFAFSAVALTYAFFAGFRTVGDPDLGWQLATGRWIVQHHAIPYTDVLSYTTGGGEWIYPVLSQVILYCTFLVGGYSLLSWLTAIACLGATAVQMRGNNVSKCLAAIAVPIIAIRTAPRAELFTTLFFAIFVTVLWRYHRTGRGKLWLLPALMVLWVNLHLGFLSGLGMCIAYVLLEFEEIITANRRKEALLRLRAAFPFLLATAAATVLNPWGIRNYFGTAKLVPVHTNGWIMELSSIPVSPRVFLEGLGLRDPRSSFWWLVSVAMVATACALFQKRFVSASILAIAIYFPFRTVRFQGPFATIVVVIGGSILVSSVSIDSVRRISERLHKTYAASRPVLPMTVCLLIITAFSGLRIWDLATNRVYLQTPYQLSMFGSGVANWFPEQAASFVKTEELPANVFNDYTSGGFVAWRLSPKYPDYVDGRGISGTIIFSAFDLLGSSLDSSRWQQEAYRRNINTIFTSIDPEFGGGLSSLKLYCDSKEWRLVYLDVKASVFIRQTPETAATVQRLQKNCETIRFDAPPLGDDLRARSERFLYYKNSSIIFLVLGRPSDALEKANLAMDLFPQNSDVRLARGLAYLNTNRMAEAESEMEASLDLESTDANSQALAGLYRQTGRNQEALRILDRQIQRSNRPYGLILSKGFIQVDIGVLNEALATFDKAEALSPFTGAAESKGSEFRTQLAQGRASAWWKLGTEYERNGLHAKSLEAQRQAAKFDRLAEDTVAH